MSYPQDYACTDLLQCTLWSNGRGAVIVNSAMIKQVFPVEVKNKLHCPWLQCHVTASIVDRMKQHIQEAHDSDACLGEDKKIKAIERMRHQKSLVQDTITSCCFLLCDHSCITLSCWVIVCRTAENTVQLDAIEQKLRRNSLFLQPDRI